MRIKVVVEKEQIVKAIKALDGIASGDAKYVFEGEAICEAPFEEEIAKVKRDLSLSRKERDKSEYEILVWKDVAEMLIDKMKD